MERAQTKRAAILALADGTRTAREIAEMVETSDTYVIQVARGRLSQPKPEPKPERDRAMMALRNRGATYREIGKQFGISHVRVHQILSRGID